MSFRSTEELAQRLLRIKLDPLEFLKAVRTKDEADSDAPIKPFPYWKPHLRLYVKLWHKEKLVLVPKSRRMLMSWTNVALYVWDVLYGGLNRHEAFVSKKEKDADDLVGRAEFIYDHLDPELIPRETLPKKNRTFCKLEFPELGSKISGFPQGADQLRQYGFSGILGDEMAFWEKAQAMYSGSLPTIQGADGSIKGRFTGISSPAGGFFKKMVFDQLEKTEDAHVEDTRNKPVCPLPGVEVWRNPKNGFVVYQLHYSADEDKRGKEFEKQLRSGMPLAQYLQEYELHWDSFSGFPVYRDFETKIHVNEDIGPEQGLPLLRGWDFGLTPACVIAQLQDDRLVVLREFTEENMGIDRFSDLVLGQLNQLYPTWSDHGRDYVDFIDPSGAFRKDTDEDTCARVLQSKGINTIPGPVTWEERRSGVEKYLTKWSDGKPNFLISAVNAPTLVRGFRGGYRYPEKAIEIEPAKIRPLKDEHSHAHDALQYIASRTNTITRKRIVEIPRMAYGFALQEGA